LPLEEDAKLYGEVEIDKVPYEFVNILRIIEPRSLRKLQLHWRDVRNASCSDSKIEIVTANGSAYVIDLKNIRNKDEAQNEVLNFYRRIQTTTGA